MADCSDDRRQSNILMKLLALRRHGLLTEEQPSRLSAETRGKLVPW